MTYGNIQIMSGLSDRDLVLRFRDGDRDAFGVLMDRYNRGVAKVLLSILSPALCCCPDRFEDVRSQVWLRMLRALRTTFNPDGNFKAFLWKVARTVSLDANKQFSLILQHQVVPMQADESEDPEEWLDRHDCHPRPRTPVEEAERVEACRLVECLLGHLPAEQRRAVEAHYLQERKLSEIAAAEEISSEGVKTRLRRAMATMRKHRHRLGASGRRLAPPGGDGRGTRSRSGRFADRLIAAVRRLSRLGNGLMGCLMGMVRWRLTNDSGAARAGVTGQQNPWA
jgi:RNA polymerase sigma-70 factor (ECF subfamily)